MSSPGALADVTLERNLLGLLMCTGAIDGAKVALELTARVPIKPEDFWLPAHAEVYAACLHVLGDGCVAEPAALWERLRARPAVVSTGGMKWLLAMQHAGEALLSVNFESYARQVCELSMRRRMAQLAREAMGAAFELGQPIEAAVGRLTDGLAGLNYRRDPWRPLTSLQEDVLDELDVRHKEGTLPVVPTGIAKLDRVIGGLAPTLTVIGGLPGAGKSALIATMVRNIARAGKKVGVFSLEDEGRWLAWRLLSDGSGVDQFILRNRRLSDWQMERVSAGAEAVYQYGDRILVDDRPGMTASDIVQAARSSILTKGVEVVFVDHLGELELEDSGDRHDLRLGHALSQLRSIAKQYNVPVVVAAHMNRKADEKPGQEPRLRDFKNSSSIGEKARVALGLCREPGSDTLGICILKQTNGQAGLRVDVTFHGAAAMIRSVEGEPRVEE
jgi:replicative DNA helicase